MNIPGPQSLEQYEQSHTTIHTDCDQLILCSAPPGHLGIVCDSCNKSDKVHIGSGTYGTDCWCLRCKEGWEQAA